MTALKDKRPAAIRVVIPFVFRHWLQQPGRAAIVAGGLLGATAADLFMPIFSGRLVDALTSGPSDPAARQAAFMAFGAIVALGLVSMILRLTGLQAIVPFTLKIMSDVSRDAFVRVQRFSTDWHANSFAGSTVRKVTRGMWALDLLNDTILMALAPSLLVLLGSMILLGLHWPVLGRGHRGGHRDLRVDDAGVLDELHRPGRARLQCMGHQSWRHAGGCADLQRGGKILRRGSARGRAACRASSAGGVRACGGPGCATTTPLRRSSRCCCAFVRR